MQPPLAAAASALAEPQQKICKPLDLSAVPVIANFALMLHVPTWLTWMPLALQSTPAAPVDPSVSGSTKTRKKKKAGKAKKPAVAMATR